MLCGWDVYLFYHFQPKLIQSLIFPPRFWGYFMAVVCELLGKIAIAGCKAFGDRCGVAVSNLPLGGYWSDWTDIKALPGLTATLNFPLYLGS